MADWRNIPRDTRDVLGEGTCWSARDNALYWVDIMGQALNRLSLNDNEVTRWPMPEPLGWVVEREQGGFIAGFQSGFAELTLASFAIRPIGDPEADLPGSRMNDGKADAEGRIWCGTKGLPADPPTGSFYRFDADHRWTKMDGGYEVPNGPAFSPDGRWLYHTDSGLRTIYRFARGEGGLISDRQTFITFAQDEGYPDGMTVDAEGFLWVAHWEGSRITRFDPTGQRERVISLPALQVTNICFAGEALDRLFVTSAAEGLSASDHDGALFEVDSGGIKGLPTYLFPG